MNRRGVITSLGGDNTSGFNLRLDVTWTCGPNYELEEKNLMVRTKNIPKKLIKSVSSAHNIVGDLIKHCAAAQYRNMVVNK